MPKIDIARPGRKGSGYRRPSTALRRPHPARLGDAGGSPIFRVNLMRLRRGNWSSSDTGIRTRRVRLPARGETVLVGGWRETILRGGDCAAFRRLGRRPPHDQSVRAVAVYLEVGSRQPATSPPAPTST